jgi:phosphotransferase system enzyme I (PtsI)
MLIRLVRAEPGCLPLLVRFFDQDRAPPKNLGGPAFSENYLGYRGVRLLEVDDTVFEQFADVIETLDLRQEIVVILPMVTSASEVRRARQLFGGRWSGVGATVETPAAALRIQDLLDVSDFVQIGLNDLTQYTMAWDRDVPNFERLPADRIVEPVEDLIASIVDACVRANVPYTLGLDLKPTPRLAAQIRRIGVTSISCGPQLVKPWKHALRSCGSNVSI